MNNTQFTRYLKDERFGDMFITELGWNNPQPPTKLPPIVIDDVRYDINVVAERSSYRILVCHVDSIPSVSTCRRIDLKVRNFANDYILVFVERRGFHHLWLAPVRKVEKRDIVTIEYTSPDQTEFLFQKTQKLSFGFNETVTIVDVRARVQEGFAVNSEKITKEFYTEFKKQHKAFAEFITGIDDHIDTKSNQNKQWYTSVMLNRLMFCYFIQKKGFLDGKTDYLGEKLEMVQKERGKNRFFRSFYIGFLRNLFHDGLNTPQHDDEFENVYGRIPYLNGGMFDEHQIERDYAGIDIADEAFERLFTFFDKWEWHLDTRITSRGKDINPDVLGYIFEQYINDRATMGAYYTKEDITEYIGRNCILPYLFDRVRTSTADSAKEFAPDGYVWRTLRHSGDRYVFDAVKKGHDLIDKIPPEIKRGIITEDMRKEYSETPIGKLPADHIPLAELRSEWNTRTPDDWGLPNEIWRETIDRIQRCDDILSKIRSGEITSINDFITYNLDIRAFASDLIANGDSRFVGWFYHALQHVTVLDPTCGSGAFLFAAMNILEPLYEICIYRMQEFNRENPAKFKEELAEITDKYRSNIQYFIYKSIILRNLYGVDIMVEATEIAKLRLFLKMVAVVDVDRRADNLGLDPLPDIDFNIRCGNTLVGYANNAQLEQDLSDNQGSFDVMLANDEFKAQIEEEMFKVAATYRTFKFKQLRQNENMATFKQSKQELRERLASLNDKLNHRLHSASNPDMPYSEWLKSHQPFNWLAEFFQIIEGNHGFDVIIGNPPYVVYTKKNAQSKKSVEDVYKLSGYKTSGCNNLYAFVIERSILIMKDEGRNGMIVPISSISSPQFIELQKILFSYNLWHSSFSNRPAKLFQNVEQRLTIFQFIKSNIQNKKIFGTKYNHWYSSDRESLFKNIYYGQIQNESRSTVDDLYIFKIGGRIDGNILKKIAKQSSILGSHFNGKSRCFFHNGPTYFIRAMSFMPNAEDNMMPSSHYKMIETDDNNCFAAILNSSLFYWYYKGMSNCRDFSIREIINFPISSNLFQADLNYLGSKISISYKASRVVKSRNYNDSIVYYEEYYPAKSKSIIDEIDTVLARHYGFTDEELDFIINNDIKYRMGDELNNSDE